jgi:hypothetical protein
MATLTIRKMTPEEMVAFKSARLDHYLTAKAQITSAEETGRLPLRLSECFNHGCGECWSVAQELGEVYTLRKSVSAFLPKPKPFAPSAEVLPETERVRPSMATWDPMD